MASYVDYAESPQQEQVARLMDEGLIPAGIAKEVGRDEANVRRSVRAIKARAAKKGHAPEHDMTRTAPEGFAVKGVSTYYQATETQPAQWVKTNQDAERQAEIMRAVVEAMKEDVPHAQAVAPPAPSGAGMCNCHILTDYHLGALAWGEESGEDWDTDKAEDLLIRWMTKAISTAPEAEVGLLAQLGDFLHYDSLESITPTSGHQLDSDSRYAFLVRVAIRSLRRVIAMMLAKYERVHVIMSDANHDPTGGIWMRELFAAFYEHEPRLTVDTTPGTFNCFEWGDTSLFFHHGHKRKLEALSEVFAGRFREVYGRTKYSYAHLGHLHHIASKETNLMVVEQHRTMAAKDAYAANGGYLSGRSADVITYSKEFGQVSRLTMTPESVDL